MDKITNKSGTTSNGITVLKCLICSYIITGLLLLFLALLLYKFDFDDGKVTIGITLIYIIASFIGGFILGKLKREKKFLWGALCGAAYFIILTLISLLVNRGLEGGVSGFTTVLVMCIGSGCIGGMLS